MQADFPVKTLDDETAKKIGVYSAIIGSGLMQDGVGWHFARATTNPSEVNCIEFRTAVKPTAANLKAVGDELAKAAPGEAIYLVTSHKGLRFLNDSSVSPEDFAAVTSNVIHNVFGAKSGKAWKMNAKLGFVSKNAYKSLISGHESRTGGNGVSSDAGRGVSDAALALHARLRERLRERADDFRRGQPPAAGTEGLAAPKVPTVSSASLPKHWAIWRHPAESGGAGGKYGVYDPRTGEPAPEGVQTGYLHGEDDSGGLRKGCPEHSAPVLLRNFICEKTAPTHRVGAVQFPWLRALVECDGAVDLTLTHVPHLGVDRRV